MPAINRRKEPYRRKYCLQEATPACRRTGRKSRKMFFFARVPTAKHTKDSRGITNKVRPSLQSTNALTLPCRCRHVHSRLLVRSSAKNEQLDQRRPRPDPPNRQRLAHKEQKHVQQPVPRAHEAHLNLQLLLLGKLDDLHADRSRRHQR